MSSDEARIARRCIADLLAAGYEISVYDGEEIVLRRSTGPKAIFATLGTTDEDHLIAYRPGEKPRAGSVWLVYGNEPGVLLADYSCALEGELAGAIALSDRLSI
jgi:hypothetical protein